jgi:hypothetical protein
MILTSLVTGSQLNHPPLSFEVLAFVLDLVESNSAAQEQLAIGLSALLPLTLASPTLNADNGLSFTKFCNQ